LIASTSCKVQLLREYRTRLIADVVTGKVDVREAAALLVDTAPDDLSDVDTADAQDELAEVESDDATAEEEANV
jgi:type I restriction enzyme S subunit